MGINVTSGNHFIYDFAPLKSNTRHKNDAATQGRGPGPGPRVGGWAVLVPHIRFYSGDIIDKMVSEGDICTHMSR